MLPKANDHPRYPSALLALLLLVLADSVQASALSDRIGPELGRLIAVDPQGRVAAWVYFTDRAGAETDPAALADAARRMTPRALDRRARRGMVAGLGASDLSVHARYVDALVSRGARLRGTSRWLNAASIEIPAREAIAIARLPFVARVERVERGLPIRPMDAVEVPASRLGGRTGAEGAESALGPGPGDPAYYGGSFRQLDMMQVPALHAQGLSGAGVLVCILDSGFRLTHQALGGLNVVAARDFIHGDTNVDDEPSQDVVGQFRHGTWTLACIAGSLPGTYSGGAFNAPVALGKTEDIASETPVEMDYWQFGAEWADSLGAEVISSSLGYTEFDNPADSYTYADMDGRSTVVTLAAAEAARRGITVVTAAGNSGTSAWHFIVAPGDADTVIAVGAVDSTNVLAGFSSRGPTSDGRTKPDVTGMGVQVLSLSTQTDSTYSRVSGTSFSTPLVAGVAALLLEANPTWRPYEVREALRETALNSASPNNDMGWGLVQAAAARSWIPSTTGVPEPPPTTGLVLEAGPNPVRAGSSATIRFAAPGAERAVVEVWDLAGRRLARLFDGAAPSTRSLAWRGESGAGARLPAGVYWIRLESETREGTGAAQRTLRVVLLH